jgi:hypothetical protein
MPHVPCVGALTVAVFSECDCECAWVVQSDRKKKRVGACVGKRKVKGKKLSTRLPMVAPHTTNPPSSDDPKLDTSSKKQIKKPIIAPQFVESVLTLIVQQLMDAELNDGFSSAYATFLAFRIHTDTGLLCFKSTTPSDAKALAWLMDHEASQANVADQARAASSVALPQSAPLPMNLTFAANGTSTKPTAHPPI